MGLEQLFCSTYYEKDASLLAQDILLGARKNINCALEEVSKLHYVQLAINEGVKTLRQTLCQDCNSKIYNKFSSSVESKTEKRDQFKKKRIPVERQHFVKELECILIQNEISKREGDIAERYVTTDEWYEQELSELKVQYENIIKELQRERKTLMKEHEESMDQYKTQINQLQRTIGSKEITITTQNETIEHYEKEREEDMAKMERIRHIIKVKDSRIKQLTQPVHEKSTQTDIKQEIETKSSSWFSLVGGSRKEELKTLSIENKKMQSDLQKAHGEIAQAELKLQQTSSELTKAHSQLDKLRDENGNLAGDLREQKEKFEKLTSDTHSRQHEKEQIEKTLQNTNSELASANSQLETLHSEKKALTDYLQKKTAELHTEKKQLDESRETIKQICLDLSEKEIELRRLREHLEENRQPRKKSIVMGLHCNRSGLGKPIVDMVVRELTKGVQDRLDSNNINLTIQFSQTPSEVTSWLKVVLCLNMSRVGTNIMDVLKEMKGDRDVFVLVLHHTNKANLSSLTPTSHRISGSEFRQLGGILDMAFSSDSGLYECDLNSYSIDKITSVLKKYIII